MKKYEKKFKEEGQDDSRILKYSKKGRMLNYSKDVRKAMDEIDSAVEDDEVFDEFCVNAIYAIKFLLIYLKDALRDSDDSDLSVDEHYIESLLNMRIGDIE